MRILFIVFSSLALLVACAATPEPKHETKAAVGAEVKAAVPAKAAQCYSGDTGKFFGVGQKSTVSGVQVTCEATSDGKSASWSSGKK